jgi:hypothetical protein
MKKLFVERANAGNLMFRLMFAEYLRRHIPGSVVTGAGIPEFGILLGDDRPKNPVKLAPSATRLDIAEIIEAVEAPGCDGIVIGYYGLRLEYFAEHRDMFMAMFQTSSGGQHTEADELVIHVRAGDILDAIHPDYFPVPISYYRNLVERTGLRPVFTGQTRDSVYSDALRRSFPDARFLAGNHWLDDFQTTRNAQNIVTAVSTFTWLAAWLSQTAKRIYMPQLGLMNPRQRPDVDLSPTADERYVFEPFPVEKFTASADQLIRIIADPAPQAGAWAGGMTATAKWRP